MEPQSTPEKTHEKISRRYLYDPLVPGARVTRIPRPEYLGDAKCKVVPGRIYADRFLWMERVWTKMSDNQRDRLVRNLSR